MLSPFRGFRDLRGEMERVFQEMFGALGRSPARPGEQASEWTPAVDVLTRDGDLVVRAELPGVRREDVDVTLQDNVLTISGEHRVEEEEERGGYYVRERRYGSFRRSIPVPEGVDESKIHARFENGVLEVAVEGAGVVEEPKRIQIEGPRGEGEASGA